MTPKTLKGWLWDARDKVISTLGYSETWWPSSQAQASTLAATFFITATLDKIGRPRNRLSVSAAWRKNDERRCVVNELWGADETSLREYEVLLDYSVHDWKEKVFLLTGESEVCATHGVRDSITTEDDYSWDFFKLLAVRSPVRLFFARVGTKERSEPVSKRIDTLEKSLRTIVEWCGKDLLAPNDELGIVLLSATKEAARSSRVLHLTRDGLVAERFGPSEPFPRLWKRGAT